MAKPTITFRSDTDPYPLTYDELDTNFLNLRDSTINFTGDAGDTRSMDLNDATAITGERNIRVTVDEATQSIKIRNTLSDYTTDPNGFENRTDSTISFNSSTRVFTIAPASTDYEMWNQGQQYTISTTKTVTITNTTGIYLVYFDGSTLSFASGAEPTWSIQTPVSYVYWNAATSEYLFTDERHGIRMDASTKEYLHETAAMAYADGFGVSNYTITGTGANNADAQLDIANGVCYDQDIRVAITHSNTPTANTWQQDLQGPARIPVVYHSGATGAWRVDAQRDYPFKNGTSLVTYNLNTTGTWSTPDCTSTYYVAYWIVATNFLNTPIIAVMGQRQDNKLSDADINNTWTSLDLTNFPAEEFRPLYRVIVRTASGYGNTPKAYFAQVDDARLDHIAVSGAAGGSGTINANTDLNAIPFYSDATIGGNALSSSKIIYTPQLVSENGISNIGGDFLLSTDNNSANSSQILIQDGTSGTIVLKSQLSYVTVQRRGSSGLLKLDGESGFIYTENSSNLTLTADGTYDASINLNASTGRITLNPGSTEVVQCQGDLDLTTGVIGTSTTNSGIELEVNGTGVIYLNGPLETNATTGTPVDDTTPVSWLKVTVGASDYYLPLYQ